MKQLSLRILVVDDEAAQREILSDILTDVGQEEGVGELLGRHDDHALHDLMTNLGGHDMETILEAFDSARDDVPTCFIAYTVKGYGLPLAGHRDNHSGLMNPQQVEDLRQEMNIARGAEWERFAGLELPEVEVQAFLDRAPINRRADARPFYLERAAHDNRQGNHGPPLQRRYRRARAKCGSFPSCIARELPFDRTSRAARLEIVLGRGRYSRRCAVGVGYRSAAI